MRGREADGGFDRLLGCLALRPYTDCHTARLTMSTDTTKPKPATKLGAEKLTPEEQRRRFEELAREAGCDEGSEARFEAAVKTIGKKKLPDKIIQSDE